jgi:hypothetical protein
LSAFSRRSSVVAVQRRNGALEDFLGEAEDTGILAPLSEKTAESLLSLERW